MRTTLLWLVRAGRLESIADLKKLYRKVVMQTHPDAIGSNLLVEHYLEIRRQYEEARRYLADHSSRLPIGNSFNEENHRLLFFRQWDMIETLEMPYAFRHEGDTDRLTAAKQAARKELLSWKPEWAGLYRRAEEESTRLKREEPHRSHRKNTLNLGIRPLVHSIIYFHLTGQPTYEAQAKRCFAGILDRLEAEGFPNLKEFLTVLTADMKNGSSILQ